MPSLTLKFAWQHRNDNAERLLLGAPVEGVDMRLAAQQIEGWQTSCVKWPSLAANEDVLYPPRLNREQSSSQLAARHKVNLLLSFFKDVEKPLEIADLTGGMGVDSLAFAGAMAEHDPFPLVTSAHVDYVERDGNLCSIMEHNAAILTGGNVDVHNCDSMEWLRSSERHYNLIFVDPARRNTQGRKVSAFEDCEPNILEYLPLITSRCDMLMIKASPMMDIDRGATQLGMVSDLFVVAVGGECKELLFLCKSGKEVNNNDYVIHCHDIHPRCGLLHEEFTRSQENEALPDYCLSVGRYLYEPDSSLMKGGPFKLLSQRYGLKKLSPNTHLYTSDKLLDWQGRRFEIVSEVSLNTKSIAAAIPGKKAHVVVRNYPMAAAALQRQLGLVEGGDHFVIATTLGKRRTGFVCLPVSQT